MSDQKERFNAQQVLGGLCLGGLVAGLAVLLSPWVINGGILFWLSDGSAESENVWGLMGAIVSVALGLLLMLACGLLAIVCLIVGGFASGTRLQTNPRDMIGSTPPSSHKEPNAITATNNENQI